MTKVETMKLWTILVPTESGTMTRAIGHDWKVMVWTKKKSAQSWLRRYAPNWHANGAKVTEYIGLPKLDDCTIRGTFPPDADVQFDEDGDVFFVCQADGCGLRTWGDYDKPVGTMVRCAHCHTLHEVI